jgi:hypothetical protein
MVCRQSARQEVLWLANGNLKKLFTWKAHPQRVSSGALASFIASLVKAVEDRDV